MTASACGGAARGRGVAASTAWLAAAQRASRGARWSLCDARETTTQRIFTSSATSNNAEPATLTQRRRRSTRSTVAPLSRAPAPLDAPAAGTAAQPLPGFGTPPSDAAFFSVSSWVTFSDLHVSPHTVDTALAVLRRVAAEARARSAGVVFLGDFWDRRGDLPVAPLNAVLRELASWEMPLLLLPGNHDQVDLGGLEHALSPLQVAAQTAHVFTRPTLFRGALWLPYRRSQGEVQDAIATAQQHAGPLSAIFGHADVLTAHVNASYQSREGLPPDVFPSSSSCPVYLGHYHLPHRVAGTAITYVGSPYQVSAAEAGQRKRLLLLDAAWQEAGDVAICEGRRFTRLTAVDSLDPQVDDDDAGAAITAATNTTAAAVTDPAAPVVGGDGTLFSSSPLGQQGTLSGGVINGVSNTLPLSMATVDALLAEGELRTGDVVQLRGAEGDVVLEAVRRRLQDAGVSVQLMVQQPAHARPRIAAAEQLSMRQLLEQYACATAMPPAALERAREVLQAIGRSSNEAAMHSRLELHSVAVEGFGPFVTRVEYPLAARGVVAVTGRNEDDPSAASNGAGKTSLLTALLWAFKAPDGRGLTVAGYVNEDSKRATVTVTGVINNEPFELSRTTTGGARPRSGLRLSVGGRDLTGQEQRLTEATLAALFATDLLPRTLVFTQEDLLGFLQSGDAEFKRQLTAVVDTAVWESAREEAAARLSDAKRQAGERAALARQCLADVDAANIRLHDERQQAQAWEVSQAQTAATAQAAEVAALDRAQCAASEAVHLLQQLQLLSEANGEQRKVLDDAATAARAQAEAVAAALEEEARADTHNQHYQQQQQQQQQHMDTDTAAARAALPAFDEGQAARVLQPLAAAAAAAASVLADAQAAADRLSGELAAQRARRERYAQLCDSSSSSNSSSNSSSGGSSGSRRGRGNGSAVARDMDTQAALMPNGVSNTPVCAAPKCEQCLQPIDLTLYHRNLESLAEAQALLEQKVGAAQDAALAAAAASAAADSAVTQETLLQHEQRRAVAAERERLVEADAALQRAAAQAELQHAQQARRVAAERAARQQQAWLQAEQLQRELHLLDQEQTAMAAARAQLEAALNAASSSLQMPQQPLQAQQQQHQQQQVVVAGATRGHQLRERAMVLCAALPAAVDGVQRARLDVQQAVGSVSPYVQSVAVLQAEVQQRKKQLLEHQEEQQRQEGKAALWRRAESAFGRSGIPSFLLEEALGQLQAACSRHLAQLAEGMSLELSATSAPRGSGTGSGRRGSSSTTAAAAAAPWDSLLLPFAATGPATAAAAQGVFEPLTTTSAISTAAASSSSSGVQSGAAAAGSKEEISKTVRIRSAGGELRVRSVSQLSGGEKKRLALALGLGFAELAAARGRLSSNVLVLDEVLEKLDEEGCACVGRLLRSLPYDSVFVVGQAGSFVTREFGCVDVVVKAGGAARVELGGSSTPPPIDCS